MHLNADISSALQLLEDIRHTLNTYGDSKLRFNTYRDVNRLIKALENPILRSVVTIQDSLNELNQQLSEHPSILPVDFEITPAGNLVVNLPPISGELYVDAFAASYNLKLDYDEQRVPSSQISPTSPIPLNSFQIPDCQKQLSLLKTSVGSGASNSRQASRLQHSNRSFHPIEDEDIIIFRSPSSGSDASKTGSDLICSEWSQVESIELVNDGTGLGFGIVGMRTMGVVVKTILPGGVADRDSKLQSGDHILQIGDVNLHDMGSEQVACVLRQSGTHVRLVVARPVHTTDYKYLSSSAPLVPTRLLHDPIELDRYLIQRKYTPVFHKNYDCFPPDLIHFETLQHQQQQATTTTKLSRVPASPSLPLLNLDMAMMKIPPPETDKFIVELKKDTNGLGITIAGYVCEKEELSGIFVKSVNKGSAADLNGNIKVNDRIVEVDGKSLQGYTNLQAVEVLRNCGNVVRLCVERYLHGPKYEQLQQAIAASEVVRCLPTTATCNTPTTTTTTILTGSITNNPTNCNSNIVLISTSTGSTLTSTTISTVTTTITNINHNNHNTNSSKNGGGGDTTPETPLRYTHHSALVDADADYDEDVDLMNDKNDDELFTTTYLTGANYHEIVIAFTKEELIAKWQAIMGDDCEIIVAELTKFADSGGLGISLEGTVDVEDGQEVRPHHYIRSILAEGPVGTNGTLKSGDELLEVNGHKLLGINHHEVVGILKELPINVRIVCARILNSATNLYTSTYHDEPTSGDSSKRCTLNRSLTSILPTMTTTVAGGVPDRLVKAKSDGSLVSSCLTSAGIDANFIKIRSRSLEPLTGLAMWGCEPQIIELIKGERGLGFSILDYQDPIDPNDTVIVIRSLVPGGVAQLDGRLIPGDRLLFVNDTILENASLDQAVQALKGAPKGIVRIGVAKPLPLPDTLPQKPSNISPNATTANSIN